jgi:hypothetical protein
LRSDNEQTKAQSRKAISFPGLRLDVQLTLRGNTRVRGTVAFASAAVHALIGGNGKRTVCFGDTINRTVFFTRTARGAGISDFISHWFALRLSKFPLY